MKPETAFRRSRPLRGSAKHDGAKRAQRPRDRAGRRPNPRSLFNLELGTWNLELSRFSDAFRLGLAGHQLRDALEGVQAFVEDLLQGLADGHFDVVFFAEHDHGRGGGHAFDDAGNLIEHLFQLAAAAELLAAGAVAAGG